LDWGKIGLNTRYERKLTQMKVKKQMVLDEHQSINERKRRAREMAADSVGGQLLIGMAAENKLPKQIFPFIEESIFNNPDASIRVQASKYFKRPVATKTYSIEDISKLFADRARGKKLFTNRCSGCHKVGSERNSIGPDLTTIGKKFDKTALLDAIINPSAAIVFGYESWLVNTKDGTSVYGFLLSQNKQAIVIKDLAGQKHIIPLQKVATKEKQEKSLMPDPVTMGLKEQNLADVTAFLLSQSNTIRR
jgi:putative heme-binding domain-containing protein